MIGRFVALVVVLLAGLAACTPVQDAGSVAPALAGTPLEHCCDSPAVYPPVVVALTDPLAEPIGRLIHDSPVRTGYLAVPDAQAAILDALRPLDILDMSNRGRLSSRFLPGRFTHVAVYLGTEAQLRALGVWSSPRIVPQHQAIRDGQVFIEADAEGVHLSPAEVVLNTDAVVVMRPQLGWSARRAAAEGFAQRLGGAFDFHFDNATPNAVYCAELVGQVLPDLALPTRHLYGRETILPEDIVLETAVGKSQLTLVAYFTGTPDGWRRATRAELVADLRDWWRGPVATPQLATACPCPAPA
ncbi:MAG: hypothetical protein GC146_10780 [Limimaricola sp.]|uniref:YiiX/YebB-like N1pC/P60 family cysteine hydrolase n=1 Tax=Limimaricola sp. TaxID=2211665 RepID=UPI001D666C66|nr:YiiX/YebB-like N1pC/P60 family cysteine hydrolase [Limimaricola sp.]MBI1417695.1 hypothetical protein [Limimaricola sp.]